MEVHWDVLSAMIKCPYKGWRLAREETKEEKIELNSAGIAQIILPNRRITSRDKLAAATLYHLEAEQSGKPVEKVKIISGIESCTVRIGRYSRQAKKLLADVQDVINSDEPPAFYRNPHCPECQFRDSCIKKLKERDCISLLGMKPKLMKKYHSKGIFSVTQLSHLFRPRRRSSRKPQLTGNYLWELKALAIREQKTFVMYAPDLPESKTVIYLDFDGVPDEDFVYLIGGIIRESGKPDEVFSYWANDKDEEEKIFHQLFSLFKLHDEAVIYHYGNYETKTIKQLAKRRKGIFKQEFPDLDKRMVNVLGYLRSYVYPPIYTNGLKAVASFLGFAWSDEDADGLHSLLWRKEWENSKSEHLKEKLLRYNMEDCLALEKVHQWLHQLSINAKQENVQQVAEMKKDSPYKFHDNPEFGEDFKFINRAAYFDYQRKKIYWRQKSSSRAFNPRKSNLPKHLGKGVVAWRPKKANEVVVAADLKKCPRCGNRRFYQLKEKTSMFRQTDIKFTSTGIKQWVVEYRTNRVKCTKCGGKYGKQDLRKLLFGDNLFAWAINLYVRYNISHELVARMLQEQFGIIVNPMYLIQRKHKWWKKWKPEVEYLWEIIKHSPVIHIDETSVKLSRDKGYVWVFTTSQTVFYHFTFTRDADFLQDWLKGYEGVIISDFFPGYEILNVKRQKCLVHLIRDLNDDLFKNPFDKEYETMVGEFGKVLRRIIETIDKFGLKKLHLQKHLKDTQRFFNQFLIAEHDSELSVKYAKRLRKHWEEMWAFLNCDNVPWNNNNAEVAVKAFAQYRRGVNGQVGEKGLREHLQMLSISQTCRYRNLSFLDYLRRQTGIWQNIAPEALPDFLPFEQAKLFIHRLGFQRKREWNNWKESGKRPSFIPSSPERFYVKKGWISWHDWLGFSFLPFPEARTFMRRLGLKNRDTYWAWLASGKRPKTIPYSPEKVYRNTGWKDLGDWLGTGNTGQQKKKRMSYEQAKTYVQAVEIKTQQEFFQWRKSGQRPETIPPDPYTSYGHEFEGWGKFLGTNRTANQDKKYWSYGRAKEFLKPLQIRSQKHYTQLYEMGIIPKEIPKKPFSYYQKEGTWISFPDFFGK